MNKSTQTTVSVLATCPASANDDSMLVPRSSKTFSRVALCGTRTWWACHVLGTLPAVEDGLNLMRDLTAGFVPVPTSGEQFIVGGLGVPDVRDYSQVHGLFIKSLCCGGSTYPPAMS